MGSLKLVGRNGESLGWERWEVGERRDGEMKLG